MDSFIVKIKSDYSTFKLIKKYAFRLAAFICGYIAANFYVWQPFQQVINKASQVEGLDKIFSIQDILFDKLATLFTVFIFITSIAMFYFWKNPNEINSINSVIKKCRFILKLPSSFLYICWFFLSGFSLYAYQHHGEVGTAIFLGGSILFALPAFMFSYWLKDEFFKPIEKEWQQKLYPWIIGFYSLIVLASFLYNQISILFDLTDWYDFLYIHFNYLFV
jgi:hypothetical protein